MHPIRWRDLPAPHLPTHRVDIVERDLLPMNVQSTYDGHRDLLKLQGQLPNTPILVRLS